MTKEKRLALKELRSCVKTFEHNPNTKTFDILYGAMIAYQLVTYVHGENVRKLIV